jgi:hypothetical protein
MRNAFLIHKPWTDRSTTRIIIETLTLQTCIQQPRRSRESFPSSPNDGQREAVSTTRNNVNERRENRGRQEKQRRRCSCRCFEETGEGQDGVLRDGSKHLQQGTSRLQLLLVNRGD